MIRCCAEGRGGLHVAGFGVDVICPDQATRALPVASRRSTWWRRPIRVVWVPLETWIYVASLSMDNEHDALDSSPPFESVLHMRMARWLAGADPLIFLPLALAPEGIERSGPALFQAATAHHPRLPYPPALHLCMWWACIGERDSAFAMLPSISSTAFKARPPPAERYLSARAPNATEER